MVVVLCSFSVSDVYSQNLWNDIRNFVSDPAGFIEDKLSEIDPNEIIRDAIRKKAAEAKAEQDRQDALDGLESDNLRPPSALAMPDEGFTGGIDWGNVLENGVNGANLHLKYTHVGDDWFLEVGGYRNDHNNYGFAFQVGWYFRNNNPCDSVCNGEASVDPQNGTPPYYYLWSTGATDSLITGLCAGNYGITVTDSTGTSDSAIITIIDSSYVNTGSISGVDTVNVGDTVIYNVNDNDGSYYSWFFEGATLLTGWNTHQISVVWDSAGLGTVGVYEIDSSNCVGDSVMKNVIVNLITGMEEQEIRAMYVYPNPASDYSIIYFENPEGKAFDLFLYDRSGRTIRMDTEITTEKYLVRLGDLAAGSYFLKLTGNETQHISHIIVE